MNIIHGTVAVGASGGLVSEGLDAAEAVEQVNVAVVVGVLRRGQVGHCVVNQQGETAPASLTVAVF